MKGARAKTKAGEGKGKGGGKQGPRPLPQPIQQGHWEKKHKREGDGTSWVEVVTGGQKAKAKAKK